MMPAAAYAVLDTETNGLFDFSKPGDAPGQPRLAELGFVYLNSALEEIGHYRALIRPDGWEMTAETTAINGLTTAKLLAEGIPVAEALAVYTQAIDYGAVVVCYGAQYDTKVMRAELRRAGLDDRFESTPNICIMRPLAGFKIPKASGKKGFPQLSDAYRHFFKEEFDGRHTALGDARAKVRLFRKMMELKVCPEPAVHFAKKKPGEQPAGTPKPQPLADAPAAAKPYTIIEEDFLPPAAKPTEGPVQTDLPSIF